MSRTAVVKDLEEALYFMSELQYPLVLKPVSSDSRAYTNDHTVEDEDELVSFIKSICEKSLKAKLTAPARIVGNLAEGLGFVHRFGIPVLIEPASALSDHGRTEIYDNEQDFVRPFEEALDFSPISMVKISTIRT